MEQDKESHHPHMQLWRMQQDLHQVQPLEGPPQDSHRREAIYLRLERLRLEVCQIWRADQTLPQTYGWQALSMSPVWTGLFKIWSPVAAHEKTHSHVDHIALHPTHSCHHRACICIIKYKTNDSLVFSRCHMLYIKMIEWVIVMHNCRCMFSFVL